MFLNVAAQYVALCRKVYWICSILQLEKLSELLLDAVRPLCCDVLTKQNDWPKNISYIILMICYSKLLENHLYCHFQERQNDQDTNPDNTVQYNNRCASLIGLWNKYNSHHKASSYSLMVSNTLHALSTSFLLFSSKKKIVGIVTNFPKITKLVFFFIILSVLKQGRKLQLSSFIHEAKNT